MNTERINSENIDLDKLNTEEVSVEDNDAENATAVSDGSSIEFDVVMDKHILYDFMINHAYTGSAGIIGTSFGALGILLFLSSSCQNYIYLIFGLIMIFYLPVNLKFQCSKQMTLNPVYKKPIHYILDSNGITVSQDDNSQTVAWDKCTKAVSTKQSIAVYTGKNNASIFSRKQLGDKLPSMLAVLSEYMDPKKIKIRY